MKGASAGAGEMRFQAGRVLKNNEAIAFAGLFPQTAAA